MADEDIISYKKYQKTVIPDDVLNSFLEFLQKPDEDVKITYEIDHETGVEIPVRKVVSKTHKDLNQAIKLYEKLYPQYFDSMTTEKVKEIQSKNDTDEEENLADKVRQAFKGGLD